MTDKRKLHEWHGVRFSKDVENSFVCRVVCEYQKSCVGDVGQCAYPRQKQAERKVRV